jgi:transposase
MIPAGVQVFIALTPVDMRSGFDRLAGLAREHMGYEARSGALFVFVGKRRTTIKVLFFDGSGMCIFHKRLDRSTFALPQALHEGMTHLEIDEGAFEALLDGIEISPQASTKSVVRRRLH